MGMFDTVMHDSLEWQTKSIDPSMGGTMAEHEVKGGRLWLLPFHHEDTGIEPPEPKPGGSLMQSYLDYRASFIAVQDPPVDTGFHGVLDLYRTLPDKDADGQYQHEYRRLIFVLGELVSEAPITQDADHADGRGLSGDWMPNDASQCMAWKLHALQGLLAGIVADPVMQTPAAQQALEAIQSAPSAAKKAVACWPKYD